MKIDHFPFSTKTIFILFFVFLFKTNGSTQNYFFNTTNSNKICEFDPTKMILSYDNYDYYQTIDDTYNGEKIEKCIDLIRQNNSFKIDGSKIDLDKPLFVRLRPLNLPIQLEPNDIYMVSFGLFANRQIFIDNIDCSNNDCNNIKIFHSQPNEQGTGRDTILKTYDLSTSPTSTSKDICYTTANLLNIQITDIILTVYLNNVPQNDVTINLSGLNINALMNTEQIAQDIFINANPDNQNNYNISLSNLVNSFFSSVLVIHTNGYPSITNQDFKQIRIQNNPSSPAIINLFVNTPMSLHFQDYTSFIGGLVEGSDTLRHTLNIIQDGSDFCFDFIDFITGHGGSFRYIKGDLNFSGINSCMNFKQQSKFIINEFSTLRYGLQSTGLLSLSDSEVLIERHGDLIIDGKILLNSKINSHSTIRLAKNAKISFTKHASITNSASENEKIYIYGYKYQIDLDALSQESKDKIVIVEPETGEILKLDMFPNPTSGVLLFNDHVEGKKGQIYNIQGQLVHERDITNNQLEIPSELPNSIYYICVDKFSKRIILNR